MWDNLGLKSNIFFTAPLDINKKGKKLFVGRKSELAELETEINSWDGGIKIVTGKIGIGKTSMLNIAQYNLFFENIKERRVLPAYRKIRLDNKIDHNGLVKEVILSLCENIREYYLLLDKKIPESIKFQIDYWLGIKSPHFEISEEIEFNLIIGALKGNNKRSDQLFNEKDPLFSLKLLIEEFLGETKLKGVFFQLDNMELLDDTNIVEILDLSRDSLFTLKNTFWFLCSSNSNLPALLYNSCPRFSSIVSGQTLNLTKLSANEVIEAIEFRISNLKLDSKSYVPMPLTKEVVRNVYSFTNYDLRESFKIFQYLCLFYFKHSHNSRQLLKNQEQLEFFIIRDTLIEYCIKYAELFEISRGESKLLSHVFINAPCTMSSIKKKQFFSNKNLNGKISRLINKGLIKFENKNRLDITFRLIILALNKQLSAKCFEIATEELLLDA